MGCGDTLTDVATGGATAVIDDPGLTQAVGGVMTAGGTNALNGDLVGALSGGASSSMGTGEIGQLTNASVQSLLSGGATNIQAAAKHKNFANQLDVFFDPSRVNDKWIRKSGTYLEGLPYGHEARQIAPQVMATVGGIYGGPVGAGAGYYFGGKIKGDSNEQNLIGAGVTTAGAAIGGAAGSYVAPAVSGALGGGTMGAVGSGVVTGGLSGAATGAMGAAATGQDIGTGAMRGGLTGAIGGGANATMGQLYNAGGVPQNMRSGLSALGNQGIKYGTTALNQELFAQPSQPVKTQQTAGPKLTAQQQATMAALFGGK